MVIEQDVVRFFIDNPTLYERFHSVLVGNKMDFTNPEIKHFWDWMKWHVDKYQKAPTWDWLYYATQSHYQLSENTKTELTQCLDEMTKSPIAVNYDQVFGFFLEKSSILFEQDCFKADWQNYDDLLLKQEQRHEFLKAIRNPQQQLKPKYEIFLPFSEEWIEASYENYHITKEQCYTTGHHIWDHMTEGGYPYGTINCIHAKSNGGKTLVMGDQALAQLKNTDWVRVVVFALDVNARPFIKRLHANAGNLAMNHTYNKEIHTHRLKMGVKSASWNDRFIIVRSPRGGLTVADQIEIIQEIESFCRPFDLERGVHPNFAGIVHNIWTDAINNVKHKMNKYTPEKRHQYDDSILAMAGFVEETVRMWGFTAQSNRGGNYVEKLTDEFIGEHHGIRQHCSMLYSLQQDKRSKIERTLGIAMNKVKAAECDYTMHFHMDKPTMSIKFNEQKGITYEDGTTHPEWLKLNPNASQGQVQTVQNVEGGILSLDPKKRKKLQKAIASGSHTIPINPLGG